MLFVSIEVIFGIGIILSEFLPKFSLILVWDRNFWYLSDET